MELWLAVRSTPDAGPLDPTIADARIRALRPYFTEALGSTLRVWVADDDGSLVACGGIYFFHRPPITNNPGGLEGHIVNMYTREAWRRRGIGGAILDAAISCARQMGAGRIRLDASEAGRPVYEKVGFRANPHGMQLDL